MHLRSPRNNKQSGGSLYTCWSVEAVERVGLQLETSDHCRSSHTGPELIKRGVITTFPLYMACIPALVNMFMTQHRKWVFQISYLVVCRRSVWGLQNVRHLSGRHTVPLTSSLPRTAVNTETYRERYNKNKIDKKTFIRVSCNLFFFGLLAEQDVTKHWYRYNQCYIKVI